jgi:hypothetical protein
MKAVVEGVEVEGEPQELAILIRELRVTQPHSGIARLSVAPTKKAPMPTLDEITAYIKSKPNYEHSSDELIEKLYHRPIGPKRSKDADYIFFYHRTQTARVNIEKEEHGHFTLDKASRNYKFNKS